MKNSESVDIKDTTIPQYPLMMAADEIARRAVENDIIIIIEQGDDVAPTELLSLLQTATKQRDEPTPDIEQVNQLIDGIDTEAIHEDIPVEDIDYDEDNLETILSELSDETQETMEVQNVEDALNFDFESVNELVEGLDVVDEVMPDTMRKYVRVWMLDVTEGLYDEMEVRRERV